ncbi:hypothetical protein EAO71_05045 [Streptomyces sp. ms191]|uniref:hypothetical protein n=1 Tax=unclassified Streptomyces TaxID=2593676 RepID=UPI0011CD4613|nr:hypothetical protein [Streptomyces sp. ms191]TXS32229.1 hypothetical protein EAO71_05045 [Streptomyces sp. ms191]
MSHHRTQISDDWPYSVLTPVSHNWESTAVRWLRELLPARYAGYATLTRHPVLLARHTRLQIEHEIRAVRVAMQTCRAELPPMGVADPTIECAIRMYAAELEQLSRLARGVRLVSEALQASTEGARRRARV